MFRGIRLAAIAVGACLVAAVPAAAAAPDTTITSGPEGPVAKRSATFRFEAAVAGATFQCKLDRKAWSACSSPVRYSRLKQGPHLFQVRARKRRAVDATPAFREFKVDTVSPNTTISEGPTGEIEDHTPTFRFTSNEADASFECRFVPGSAFETCFSPYTPAEDLPDESYEFDARARDAAGNTDETPAVQSFTIETPVAKDLATAQAAAAHYFPDTVDVDVPAECGGNPEVDCPGGTPLPPSDQLRLTSSRSVAEVAGAGRYDVTVVMNVQTLEAIKVNLSGVECDVTLTSANGSTPTWQLQVPLNFVVSQSTGEFRIVPGAVSINNLEDDDVTLTGGFLCSLAHDEFLAYVRDAFPSLLANHSLCAAPGPAYLGPCPPTP